MNELILIVPAHGEWILALRATLSAVGALAGLSLDMIDDLRIAADEAFDLLTHQPRKLDNVRMTCRATPSQLQVQLEGFRTHTTQQCVPADAETARLVIGTLVTEMHLEGDSCGIHSVCMSLPSCGLSHER